MVGTIPKKLPAFLQRVHQINRASGLEELAHAAGVTPRSTQRWHQAFKDLVYFPNTEYEAFGLVHLHIFLVRPRGAWEDWAYGIHADWVVRQPGEPVLYLHSLVPCEHEAAVRLLLEELHADGWADAIEIVTTRDPWQCFEQQRATFAYRRSSHNAWDVIERFPLVLPVVFEMTEQRRTIPEVWNALWDRLGDGVWNFLPDGIDRLPHNGKCYVREALHLLNESFLVRQHIIRFPSQYQQTIDVLAVIKASLPEVLHFVGSDAPSQEILPIAEDLHLLRITSTVPLLRRVLSAESSVRDCWLVDHQRPRLPVRFAYELLFSPATTE